MGHECLGWDLSTLSVKGLMGIFVDRDVVDPNLTVANLVEPDLSLPKMLWRDTHQSACDDQVAALIELNIHALKIGHMDNTPIPALLQLHAANRLANETAGGQFDRQTLTAICALRTLEMVLRCNWPVDLETVLRIYDKVAGSVNSDGVPLLQALLKWLRKSINDPASPDTPFDVLDSMELNRLEAVCESSHLLVEPFFDGSLIATSNGVLLLDN